MLCNSVRAVFVGVLFTGYEPNSELDVAGRFVPTVASTEEDEDGNPHMADIALQLTASASASVAPKNSECSKSPSDTDSDGVNSGQLQCPSTYPQSSPAVLGP